MAIALFHKICRNVREYGKLSPHNVFIKNICYKTKHKDFIKNNRFGVLKVRPYYWMERVRLHFQSPIRHDEQEFAAQKGRVH